jgi:hypothetical protein
MLCYKQLCFFRFVLTADWDSVVLLCVCFDLGRFHYAIFLAQPCALLPKFRCRFRFQVCEQQLGSKTPSLASLEANISATSQEIPCVL